MTLKCLCPINLRFSAQKDDLQFVDFKVVKKLNIENFIFNKFSRQPSLI